MDERRSDCPCKKLRVSETDTEEENEAIGNSITDTAHVSCSVKQEFPSPAEPTWSSFETEEEDGASMCKGGLLNCLPTYNLPSSTTSIIDTETGKDEAHAPSISSIHRPPALPPTCSTSGVNWEEAALENPSKTLQGRHEDPWKLITVEENTHTVRKTIVDVRKFQKFMAERGEHREMQHVPVRELDTHISEFLKAIKKPNGDDYETSSVRNMVSSFDRKLRQHDYPHSIMACTTNEFKLTRKTLEVKLEILKRGGKGNRPNESEALTDDDIGVMYKKCVLGLSTPESILNTLWLNNSILFGFTVAEHYELRWGDVSLMKDDNGEYLEQIKRQSKTRNGENFFSVDSSRDPVSAYKFYASKRPSDLNSPDSPFYLAPRTIPILPVTDQWFLRQKVGYKKLSSLMKKMTSNAGLSGKRLTNHSVRKHLVQIQRNNNIAPTEITQSTGHKNIHSVIDYSKTSNEILEKCSRVLSSNVTSLSSTVNEETNQSNTSRPDVNSPNEVHHLSNNTHAPHDFTPTSQSTIDIPVNMIPVIYRGVLFSGVFPTQSMVQSENGETQSIVRSENRVPMQSIVKLENEETQSMVQSENGERQSMIKSENGVPTQSMVQSENGETQSMVMSENIVPLSSMVKLEHIETQSMVVSENGVPMQSIVKSENSETQSMVQSENGETQSMVMSENRVPLSSMVKLEHIETQSMVMSENRVPVQSMVMSKNRVPMRSMVKLEHGETQSMVMSENGDTQSIVMSENRVPVLSMIKSENGVPIQSMVQSENEETQSIVMSENRVPLSSMVMSENGDTQSIVMSENRVPVLSMIKSENGVPIQSMVQSENEETQSIVMSENRVPLSSMVKLEHGETQSMVMSEYRVPLSSMVKLEQGETQPMVMSENGDTQSIVMSENRVPVLSMIKSENGVPIQSRVQSENGETQSMVMSESRVPMPSMVKLEHKETQSMVMSESRVPMPSMVKLEHKETQSMVMSENRVPVQSMNMSENRAPMRSMVKLENRE